ncbi:hypothetical protein OG453_41385 [Streptomyces sp. NBC_01381]|uniref:hypothetical protein n=1 Tax=Streptomyces sp. NBC_01381 TaxID=2903845 RepID=UPI002254BF9D|nr:hypothetical protein [Streptomyces sp. NBC_01381]MCX4673018.1 hypothetical protein [Streptomyces sp. NBC_01381]
MGDIPKSRDAKHPFLRQILTPFYRTRMRRIQRNHATISENRAKIKRARSDRAYVKQLKKDGTLK